jgi:hypothetical protein
VLGIGRASRRFPAGRRLAARHVGCEPSRNET